MKTQHTPGPWKVVTNGPEQINEANPFDIFAQDHQCIARISNWSPEANARLIAAAPELLQCLQNALAVIHVTSKDADTHLVKEIEASIYKALGQ